MKQKWPLINTYCFTPTSVLCNNVKETKKFLILFIPAETSSSPSVYPSTLSSILAFLGHLTHTYVLKKHTQYMNTHRESLRSCSCRNQPDRSNAASAFLNLKSAFIWQSHTILSQTWLFWHWSELAATETLSPSSHSNLHTLAHSDRAKHSLTHTYYAFKTYRYSAVEAGSFSGRSALHAISGVW